jgi:hypothetical protein
MRQQLTRLVKATKNPCYPHEEGRDPFNLCLSQRNTLIAVLRGEIAMNEGEIYIAMTNLKDSWDNVIMARKRAMGRRITEAWVLSSPTFNDFVSYLEFLQARGFSQTKLDRTFVETMQSVLGDSQNA